MKYDKRWLYLSVLAIASTWLVQLTQSVKITVLIGIYWLCKSLTEKKLNLKIIMAEICGLFIAFIIWWGPMLLKYKGNFLTLGLGQYSSSTFKTGAEKAYFGVIGSAKGFYTFNDFFIAKHINRINNPIGVGVVICLLLVVSLLYIIFKFKDSKNKKEWWKFTAMLWLLFTFLGIHGGTRFPIAFWSFRFWMLFAIPMSILVSEGAWFLIRFIDGFNTNRTIKFLFRTVMLTLIIAGVWFTSGAQKYSVNTAIWGPGGWLMAKNEAEGYIWLKQNLPINTRVFPFSIAHANRMAGLDMESCEWCPEVIQFREYLINKTPDPMEAYNFLRSEGYEYAIIDAHYAEQLGANETNELISSLIASGLFQPVKQTQTTIAFKLL
ncbi:hypothetical protein KY366_05910 [Candidatus Woesearchaeota archaeon]|nr:hypothetical protein [Candidatus Woesearchaeota archaeon]